MKKYTCYHFSSTSNKLGYNDGREIRLGETLEIEGTPSLCAHGLHGSMRVTDALKYAAGTNLWQVEIWGDVQIDSDKLCGNFRKAIVEYGNVLPLIVAYAFDCAESAKYAESAAKSAKYARYAEYAAKSARYAEYAATSAKYAEYAAKSARYAATSAKYAEYAAEYAEYAAEAEKERQEEWWKVKLSQISGIDI